MWIKVVCLVAIAAYVVETADVCLKLTLGGVLITGNQQYEGSYRRSSFSADFCVNGGRREVTFIQELNPNLYLFYVDYSYSDDGGWRFDQDVCQNVHGIIASIQHSYEPTPMNVPGDAWVEWNETSTSFFTNNAIILTCTETGPDPLATTTTTTTTTSTTTTTTTTTAPTTTPAGLDNAVLIGGIVGGLGFAGVILCICFALFRDKCSKSSDESKSTERKRENKVDDVYVNASTVPQAPTDSKLLANGTVASSVPMFVNVSKKKENKEHKKPRIDAFISYREDTGSDFASLVRMHLESKGLRCFMDCQTMPDGQIDPSLEEDMALSSNFLIVLSAGALDKCQGDEAGRDRVHVASAAALRMKKRIIPLIDVKSFKWPTTENLPQDMQELPLHNGIKWVHEYQSACLKKLVTFLKSKN